MKNILAVAFFFSASAGMAACENTMIVGTWQGGQYAIAAGAMVDGGEKETVSGKGNTPAFKEAAIDLYNKKCKASEVNLPPTSVPRDCPDRAAFTFVWVKAANGAVLGSIDYMGKKGPYLPNIGIADLLQRTEAMAALYCAYSQ